jgi:hypothetical protein
LRDRFRDLNHKHDHSEQPPSTLSSMAMGIDAEIQAMEDTALLRYGAVLRHICAGEADLQDPSLEGYVARLRIAQRNGIGGVETRSSQIQSRGYCPRGRNVALFNV